MAFGKKARSLREESGLGLRAAARRLRISATYLSRFERDLCPPPAPPILRRMAVLYGVAPDMMFAQAGVLDPVLVKYLVGAPAAVKFVRYAKRMSLRSEDFIRRMGA